MNQSAFEIASEPVRAGTVVRITGSLDAGALDRVRPVIRGSLEKGVVLLELSGVAFLDSSGLGLLVSLVKDPWHAGCLRLVAPRPEVRRTFSVTRLDRLLPIFDSLELAAKKPAPKRILLLEPDLETRSAAEAVFTSFDYNIVTGADALGESRKVDLIIAATSERATVARLRDKNPEIPLLMLVTEITPADRALDDPASLRQSYFRKPFDPYDLLGKARIMLRDRSGEGAKILGCLPREAEEEIAYAARTHGYFFENAALAGAFTKKLDESDWWGFLIAADPKGGRFEDLVETVRSHPNGVGRSVIAVCEPRGADEIRRILSAGAADILALPVVPEALIGKLARHAIRES